MSPLPEDAEKLKAEATEQFKLLNYEAAAEKYEVAADKYYTAEPEADTLVASCEIARVACLNNAAMCYLKLESWTKAKAACDKVRAKSRIIRHAAAAQRVLNKPLVLPTLSR
jgi:tetratricopeptide (TPR) repeat protein